MLIAESSDFSRGRYEFEIELHDVMRLCVYFCDA